MPASKYLRERLTKHVLLAQGYTSPTSIYVSLHTSDPTPDALSNTEATWSGYQRQLVAFAAQTVMGQTSNSATLTYPQVTGASVTITHFALWDSLTGGNMLESAALASQKVFSVSDVPSWLAGQLTSTMT